MEKNILRNTNLSLDQCDIVEIRKKTRDDNKFNTVSDSRNTAIKGYLEISGYPDLFK